MKKILKKTYSERKKENKKLLKTLKLKNVSLNYLNKNNFRLRNNKKFLMFILRKIIFMGFMEKVDLENFIIKFTTGFIKPDGGNIMVNGKMKNIIN